MDETSQKLRELMVSRLKLKVKPDDITDDTVLFAADGLDLDSVDVLELIVGIKKEFGVEITDRKVAEQVFTSVGAIVKYIEENK